MMFSIFCEIDTIIKRYTEAYDITNRDPDLKIVLIASVNDEQKEFILNDLDYCLRDLIDFSHEYKNGKLQITFN